MPGIGYGNLLRENEFSHSQRVNSPNGPFRLGNALLALLSRMILAVDGNWPEIHFFADSHDSSQHVFSSDNTVANFTGTEFHHPIPCARQPWPRGTKWCNWESDLPILHGGHKSTYLPHRTTHTVRTRVFSLLTTGTWCVCMQPSTTNRLALPSPRCLAVPCLGLPRVNSKFQLGQIFEFWI